MILKVLSPALSSLPNYELYLSACLHLCVDFLISEKLPSWAFILLACSLFRLSHFRKRQLCQSGFSSHNTWSHHRSLSFSPSHFFSLSKSFGLYLQSTRRIWQFFTPSTRSLFWVSMCPAKIWRHYYHGTKRKDRLGDNQKALIQSAYLTMQCLYLFFFRCVEYPQGREPQVPTLKSASPGDTNSL